jgi:hypothetical protein
VYLEDYGHIQSVDQALALKLAQERGLLHDGDLIVLAGAGTGYTWSATALRWGGENNGTTKQRTGEGRTTEQRNKEQGRRTAEQDE